MDKEKIAKIKDILKKKWKLIVFIIASIVMLFTPDNIDKMIQDSLKLIGINVIDFNKLIDDSDGDE